MSDHTVQPSDKGRAWGKPLCRPTAEEAPWGADPQGTMEMWGELTGAGGLSPCAPKHQKGIEDISIVKSAFKLLVKDKGIVSLEGGKVPFACSKTLGYNQARRGSKKSATQAAYAGTEKGGRREASALSR